MRDKHLSFNFYKGFTLIELLVVISIIGILALMGIGVSINYAQTAKLTTAAQDVANMLQTAKSRAQSQVKPDDKASCTNTGADNTLYGYAVKIISTPPTYELDVSCGPNDCSRGNMDKIYSGSTPTGLSIVSTPPCILFPVLTGTTNGSATVRISISNSSQSKTINIDRYGVINGP